MYDINLNQNKTIETYLTYVIRIINVGFVHDLQ